VIDHLHHRPGIDAGQVAEHLEPESRLVVERRQHRHHVARTDAHLGLVMPLADRSGQLLAEAGLQALLEASVHA